MNNKIITLSLLCRTTKDLINSPNYQSLPKIAYRRIAPSTNQRTLITTVINNFGGGDSIFFYVPGKDFLNTSLTVSGIFCSFAYGYEIRIRLAGANLSEFIMAETSILNRKALSQWGKYFCTTIAQLCFASHLWSREWIALLENSLQQKLWKKLWAITPYERLRLRCILDAAVAELYGLDIDDFAWILRDCDHPTTQVCDKKFARTLDPKGFWRVDKEKDPELRHPVLSLVAFHELKRLGLETFLNLNDGEGWMLPETLRLADYDLGHDRRAKEPQPVAARLGDRFLPWQLEGTVEESWQECDRHAENLKRLLGNPEPKSIQTPPQPQSNLLPSDPNYQLPTDLFGNPLPVDLFGNIIEEKPKRKKR